MPAERGSRRDGGRLCGCQTQRVELVFGVLPALVSLGSLLRPGAR